MSYPPPPSGQNPNPYAAPQQPQQPGMQQPGMPQQPGPGFPQYPQQAQAGPQGYPAYPAYPGYPGGPQGMMPQHTSMPGITVAARVLLFVAGAIWALMAVGSLIAAVAVSSDDSYYGDIGLGLALLFVVIFGGIAALHIVPASLFGKGRTATRVLAIIAASLNSLCAILGFLGSLTPGETRANPVAGVLWLGVAVCTLVFCSVSASGRWFNRPVH